VVVIRARFTPEEADRIDRAIQATGGTYSDLVRRSIQHYLESLGL
jgi:predicted DNA-binding protein